MRRNMTVCGQDGTAKVYTIRKDAKPAGGVRYAKSAKAWHSLGTWPITTFPLAAASTRSPRCYAQLLQCASSVLPGGSQAYEHGVPDMQTTTDSNNPTIRGQRLLGPQAVWGSLCCLRGCPLVTCSPHERTRRRPHTNTASQLVLGIHGIPSWYVCTSGSGLHHSINIRSME